MGLNSKASLAGSKPLQQDCLGVLFSDMLVFLQEMPGTEPGVKRFTFLKEDGPAVSCRKGFWNVGRIGLIGKQINVEFSLNEISAASNKSFFPILNRNLKTDLSSS